MDGELVKMFKFSQYLHLLPLCWIRTRNKSQRGMQQIPKPGKLGGGDSDFTVGVKAMVRCRDNSGT